MSRTDAKDRERKIRLGQFMTSGEIAEFMARLTKKDRRCRVLDPSAGKGVFIEALIERGFQNISAVEYDEDYYRILKEEHGDLDIRNQDFLSTEQSDKFDLIIGNPPYVQWNRMEPQMRERLKNDAFWAEYSNGEWDLSYAFIIWSVEKLNEGGELIFIVPYNWFNSTHASSLRKYLLKHGHFDTILHFGELKLFADCFPNNIIFKYVKSKAAKHTIMVCDYNEKRGNITDLLADARSFLEGGKGENLTTMKCFEMEHFSDPEMWYLGDQGDLAFIRDIEAATRGEGKRGYRQVADRFDVCVGMVSGLDKAFLVTEDEMKTFTEEEKRHVFRFIKAKDCRRYSMENTSHYIFVDDVGSEMELGKLPNIRRKLAANKAELLSRYDGDSTFWWRWATVRNYGAYKKNLGRAKIFVPCIDRSLQSRFSYTDGPYYGSGDVLMIAKADGTREDTLYALAWLNSIFVERWYRIKGSKKGQRIQYTQAYVSKIPFRAIDWSDRGEVKLHDRIVALSKRLVKNNLEKGAEGKIDALFGRLVGIGGTPSGSSSGRESQIL